MRTILSLFLSALIAFSAFSETGEDIAAAIKVGNSKELSKYFASTIELTVIGKEGNYSKAQAELILKDFFTSHPVSDFQIMHKGGEEGASPYTIGTLATENKNYRVFYLLKKEKDKLVISQLRIETEEE